jgi:hypothetical protein
LTKFPEGIIKDSHSLSQGGLVTMRVQKMKVRVGNSVVTIIDNGKSRVQTVRPFKDEVINEK